MNMYQTTCRIFSLTVDALNYLVYNGPITAATATICTAVAVCV